MPRIAVAIFVVVAVSVSIGINITLYPAVFNVVGSTHESLVSDDTKEVPETKETEGPVAVNALPALPDDLAKWNPPMVRDAKPAITETVPYVVARAEEVETYEGYARPQVSQPYAEDRGEGREERGEDVSVGDRGQAIGDREKESESYIDRDAALELSECDVPEEVSEKKETGADEKSAVKKSSKNDLICSRPTRNDSVGFQQVSAKQQSEEREPKTPSWEYQATPFVSSGSERPRPGAWPATVADSFQYHQAATGQTSGAKSEDPPSRPGVTATTSEDPQPSVRKPLRQVDSAMIFDEGSDWEASVPMVALRDNESLSRDEPLSSREVSSSVSDEERSESNVALLPVSRTQTRIKRLPEVAGADVLPGALPPSKPIDYPATR